MTKAENRAAARAYAAEREVKRRTALKDAAIAADLEKLREFRQYFLRDRKVWVHVDSLISVIDDVAERLTGDRTALHSKNFAAGFSVR